MSLSSKDKNTILKTYMKTEIGISKLALSMVRPLEEQLNSQSLCRHILKKGTVKTGKYLYECIKPEIHLNPVNMNHIHSLWDRVAKCIKTSLVAFEDDLFFRLIESKKIKPIKIKETDLKKDFFDSLHKKFKYGKIVANAYGYSLMRRGCRDDLDFECVMTLLRNGVMARINEAPIIVKRLCPRSLIFLFAENVGKIEISPLSIKIKSTKKKTGALLNFIAKDKLKMVLNSKAVKILEIVEE